MFNDQPLSPGKRAEIDRGLARLDVSSRRGRWTRQLLELLRAHPGAAPAELAAECQRPVGRLKSDVWKLRELGLVESLPVGYQLSPRGRAYLDRHC